MYLKTTFFCVLAFVMVMIGCKKWEEHTEVENQDLTKTLLEEISQRSNLSKFLEYVKKTGLDKELASSKTYTVWAPVNDALQTLDPTIIADTAKLRQFVSNHISYQTYFTRNAATPVRVPMLNGKRVTFTSTKFDDATITEKDKYVSNGVLQVIDKMVAVLPNAWELVNNTKTAFQQSAYILSLTRNVFDPTNAIIDSISSTTGQPIYRPGTDSVLKNVYNTEVYDLQNEAKQYTYFILNDGALNAEITKMNPFYKTSTADSTKNLASFAVVKDLTVEGVYEIAQLPAFLTSKFGVKIPIDVSKIVETRRMSNGIAYVMNSINFDPKEKIRSVIIEGENYRGFFDVNGVAVTPRQNNVSAIFIRSRITPPTAANPNALFTDMFAYGHGIVSLNAQYRVQNLPSVKYKVYWVAPNDTLNVNGNIAIAAFTQRLSMGVRGATGANLLPTVAPLPPLNVVPRNFNEVYLGDYTMINYGTLDMFLTNATATTGEPAGNRLNLDYIRLVPDL
jgi:uncharacterized surface protein with fasciclin (FAS1) repeats